MEEGSRSWSHGQGIRRRVELIPFDLGAINFGRTSKAGITFVIHCIRIPSLEIIPGIRAASNRFQGLGSPYYGVELTCLVSSTASLRGMTVDPCVLHTGKEKRDCRIRIAWLEPFGGAAQSDCKEIGGPCYNTTIDR